MNRIRGRTRNNERKDKRSTEKTTGKKKNERLKLFKIKKNSKASVKAIIYSLCPVLKDENEWP